MLLRAPNIPAPPRPDDVSRGERERMRRFATQGDPLRDTRERRLLDSTLGHQDNEIVGPTAAFTLAERNRTSEMGGRIRAEGMGQLDEMEEERRFMAEGRLGELETQRGRDLDEWRQLVTAQEAMEEVTRANFQSGLLRAGAGLVGTIAGGPLGATIGSQVGDLFAQPVDPSRQANVGLSSADPNTLIDLPGLDVPSREFRPGVRRNDFLRDAFDTGPTRTHGLFA